MDGHLCHGAVNKPTAMDIQPSLDVHRRIPERNLSLKYIYLHKLVKSTNTAENKMYKHKYAIYCSALQLRIFSPVQCHLQQRQEAVYEDYNTVWGAVCVKIQKQMTFTKTRGVYVNRQASPCYLCKWPRNLCDWPGHLCK